jgi:hypothetical protein
MNKAEVENEYTIYKDTINNILEGLKNEIINSNEGPSNLYKEMMRFSREKVRATDNLLGLYSFLNIFALGMLVYIYMSM